jgi:predicted DNA-binding transcriptional regulator AlpA
MKLLLDINEVASALNVSRRTAYALRSVPSFPKPVTLAERCVRYRASEVAAFVDGLEADPTPTAEPTHLRAGKQARAARKRGSSGGVQNRTAEEPRQPTTLAERVSVELANPNRRGAA